MIHVECNKGSLETNRLWSKVTETFGQKNMLQIYLRETVNIFQPFNDDDFLLKMHTLI